MPYRTAAIVLGFAAFAALAAAAFAQKTQAPSMPADLARMAESAQSRYLPEYTDSGDMKLRRILCARMGLCRLAIDTQRAQWWPRRLP